jgi:hypothetical protein
MFENNPGIVATIFRDNNLTPVHGPSRCLVDEIAGRSQKHEYRVETQANGNELPTNIIAIEPEIEGVYYKPFLEDLVYITGSTGGVLDGSYEVKEYSLPVLAAKGRYDYTQLKVRYLGPKKPGDTEDDNGQSIIYNRWS